MDAKLQIVHLDHQNAKVLSSKFNTFGLCEIEWFPRHRMNGIRTFSHYIVLINIAGYEINKFAYNHCVKGQCLSINVVPSFDL